MEVKIRAIRFVFVIVLITIHMEAVVDTIGEDSSSTSSVASSGQLRNYEAHKRRDWNKFLEFLENQKPPLTLEHCSGAHVIEFLKFMDQFSKTRVHVSDCPHFGRSKSPAYCACPVKQAWGSLSSLIGRLRTAYKESGGRPESNPFDALAVHIYLRKVRECQAKARGIPYQRKKQKLPTAGEASASSGGAGSEWAADIFFI